MLRPSHLWFFFAIGAFAQPSGTGVISGIVIDAASGDPVKKAIVTVTWHGQPRSWATARTPGDGLFRFDGLPPGNYDLRAQKQGIGNAAYGAERIGETGAVIPLADGQTRDGLKLRFVHSSSISGHVLDSGGEPIAMANVTLYRVGRNLGERTLLRAAGNQTDDRGEFKLNNVQPGRYYLSASTQLSCCLESAAFAPAYHGDARDWKNSNPVVVRDGDDLTGVDFHLARQPLVELHGHVHGIPQQAPAAPPPAGRVFIDGGSNVQVLINGIDGIVPSNLGIGANGPDGAFGGFYLLPGLYRFDAHTRVGDKAYAATQTVDLEPGTGDIELTLAPAPDLKGHLRLEGGTAAQTSAIQVTLNRAPQRGQSLNAHPAADGTFTLSQVPPGEWVLTLNPMPRGSFLKSVMLGDKDVRFQPILVESGTDAALNIVVSMNTAKISGDAASPGAGILFAPTGKFHEFARFYYAVTAGDDGKFKINGVAPGTYKIFALERLSAMNYRSPEAADAFDTLMEAPTIEVTEGATMTVEPKLIPFERAREVIP